MFEARIAELNRFNEQNPVSYDKRTYTVDEIQDILGISRPTAYNLVKRGVFHSVRVGGHIRISKRALMTGWITQMNDLSRMPISKSTSLTFFLLSLTMRP